MSSTFKPFGLSIAAYIGGKPRESSFVFPIASGTAANIGSGDPVALVNGSVTSCVAATAFPPAAVNEIVIGVFQSVAYNPSQQGSQPATFPYWISGTTTANSQPGSVSVNVDPMQVYNIQSNGTLSATAIGSTYTLGGFANTGTIAPGQSAVYLNASNQQSTTQNFGQVKLLGLAPSTPAYPSNSWSDPYPIVQVVLNSTFVKLGTYSTN